MTVPKIAVVGMWANSVSGLRFSGNSVATALLQSVVRAGGEPVTLFAESPLAPLDRLAGFDGVLIPGGNDIKPEMYGQEAGSDTKVADYEYQDEFERDILAAALKLGLPTLAVCRGFQMLNVMHGGTLMQDLPPEHEMHRNGLHDVDIAADSRLASVLNEHDQIRVSSYHHQAVDQIGAGLRAVARAQDGIVEALEPVDSIKPVVAIQWHPEDNAATDQQQQALFDWLVTTANMQSDRMQV
ncbi:gamma-glutamyl-gamma-aminobutyrate hydrolase family protein [Yaniella flava]|uniref:Gamma-glutamyl-gamma-aminobutyrate hydrolase family protein n=1 Tax=Yaniella flava TaxID=287930 RepID=A0ABP5FM13_9MICC